jgi:carbamoyl-phosphate synthase/aspartate carbamoyltransferase/dihydroorotase
MKASIKCLASLGYKLYGSIGTADYYNHQFEGESPPITVEPVDWHYESIGEDQDIDVQEVVSMATYLSSKHFELVINLPMRTGG